MKSRILFLVLLTLSASLAAQTTDYERVLVPLHRPGEQLAGGFGSLWETHLQVFNANDVPAIVTPSPNCNIMCVSDAWQSQSFARPWGVGIPGAFHYIGGAGVDPERVVYHLRIQDITRQAATWGTEIPVVRRREFRSDAIHLLNVPLDARFRQTTRIYDFEGKPMRVRVRVFPMDPLRSNVVLGERDVELILPPDIRTEPPPYPAYAQLGDILTLFPESRSEAEVHIEITPLEAPRLFWAFAAITNNETQHVTIIVPR